MRQPVFWALLLVVAVGGVGARLLAGRPLIPVRSAPLGSVELVIAGGSLLVLIFHCLAMFFAPWVDLVPFLRTPAASVRALGTGSQVTYWVPAALLVIATRRVWPPVLGVLVVTLAGVGVTMFWSFALVTHLAWIAAAVVTTVAVLAGVVVRPARPAT